MKRNMFSSCLFLLVFLATGSAHAWVESNTLLANAEPDECYAGIGVDYPDGPPCPVGSIEKTNQAYVWGLTQTGDSLWFGTGANILCTTYGVFLDPEPTENDYYVCEFGESQIARENPSVDPSVGDWRPPKIYRYDLTTHTLIDQTPDDPMIELSMGIRSAGSHNDVVFMAGGSLDNNGIIMFAFDSDTREYLGSHRFIQYSTIRKWLVVKGQLYTGVGLRYGDGQILRWRGSRNDLWNFQVVGQVDGVPRELAEYIDGKGRSRIAVSATGIWISPSIWFRGLFPWQSRNWKQIWAPGDYEPDKITGSTYAGGDLHCFDGWLYFGTMHIPPRTAIIHSKCRNPQICFGEPESEEEWDVLNEGTWRATTIWRTRNLESSNPEIQLLYGEAELPAYNPVTRTFDLVPNLGGYQPLYGSSGFGNKYNIYDWTMEAADGHLFVGTADGSQPLGGDDPVEFGADLWSFDSSDGPAVAEDINGLGNPLSYGIRTLIASEDGTKLYAGMANSNNLAKEGGWELRELSGSLLLSKGRK
jgi:hypothetical protein